MLVMPGVAQAGQDGLAEALGWQQRPQPLSRPPPQQRTDDRQIGECVHPERRDNAVSRYHQTAERRSDGARHIHAGAVGGNRRRQIGLGNQLRHDRLPGRHRQRPGGADQEGEQQEIARCRQTQTDNRGINRRDRGRQRFNDEQEFPLVENVGERAGGNREQENRQRARRLHQSDDQRIGIEAGHQPARCGAVHPPADIGDQRRRPDDGKGGMAKRRPKDGALSAAPWAVLMPPPRARKRRIRSQVPCRRQIHGRRSVGARLCRRLTRRLSRSWASSEPYAPQCKAMLRE